MDLESLPTPIPQRASRAHQNKGGGEITLTASGYVGYILALTGLVLLDFKLSVDGVIVTG